MDHKHEIAELAAAFLQESPYSTIRAVSCQCIDGTIVLRGQVPSFYEKQLAQEAVTSIDGTMPVVNEVEVAAC